MKILLVTGMPLSGKEEFLTVARKTGIPFLRMGDIVRETYAADDAASAGMSVGEFASSEREQHGKDIWAKRAIQRMYGNIFLVDGCRSMDEVISYRKLSDDVEILAVFAPPKLRYERLVKRARDDAPKSIGEFDARDSRELSWGLGSVIALADRTIDNSSDLNDFRSRADAFLKELK